MSTLPSPVQPGQIITAKFFNDLIAKVKELEERLNATQPGGSVPAAIIDHFDPAIQQEVGKQLTIFGRFDFPPPRNNVEIDAVPITNFRVGSNDAQLIIVIPSIAVPAGGNKEVRIKINNSLGSDDKAYRLLPATPSTIPNPVIVNVINHDTPANPPQTGKKVLITGANFAAIPGDNNITFTIQLFGGPRTFPAGAIDLAATRPDQIVVTAPDIPDIGMLSTFPVVIKVDVRSPLPATFQVSMIRLPLN